MKKLFLLFAAVCAVAACGKDGGNGNGGTTPELSVSHGSLAFTGGAGEKSFSVTSDISWTISGAPSWCSVTPASGQGGGKVDVKVSVTENTGNESRSATLEVKGGDITRSVVITQGKVYALSVDEDEFADISTDGDRIVVKVTSSDPPRVTIDGNWITSAGVEGEDHSFDIAPNETILPRAGSITFTVGDLEAVVSVSQLAVDIYIPDDPTGMTDDAMTMSAKMGLGWNIGNTMEPPTGEGTWNNPFVTQALIEMVAEAGFKNIRIPCAWDSHIVDRQTNLIDPRWLDRVAQVVEWCLEEDLHVMLNIHWDGGWADDNPYYEFQDEVNAKLRAIWRQIAFRMRDFDQKLIFAGTNEVRRTDYNPPTLENIEVQLSFNQTFVDAVRSTGGKNAYRNLVVQAFNTNIDNAVQYLTMPEDTRSGRLFTEVHYYDPFNFTIDSGSTLKLVWGNRPEAPVPGQDSRKPTSGYSLNGRDTGGDEDWADDQFAKMKARFVDRGIPVVVGEYGATFRPGLSEPDASDNYDSIVYYIEYVTAAMVQNGLVPMYWDNGATGDGSGIFDRTTYETAHPALLQAIMKSAQ